MGQRGWLAGPAAMADMAETGERKEALARSDFAAIVERNERELLGFLRGLVGEAEQARDLLQDTFYDAWRAAKRVAAPFVMPASPLEIRRWLYHTAYCRAISARRHGRMIRWESLDAGDGEAFAVQGVLVGFEDQIAEAEALGTALKDLTPEDVACLSLIVVQGFTASEAAEIMDASAAAVAKRIARAKRRLLNVYLAQNASGGEGGRA